MKIICQNGFYKFYPQNVAEIARFENKSGLELVRCDDYYTFPILAELPNFSFQGQIYSGILPALVNFAGSREEVMAENGYCYNLALDKLALKSLVFEKANYFESNYIVANSLIQAYSYDSNGKINGFNGFVDVDFMKFKIDQFYYENI